MLELSCDLELPGNGPLWHQLRRGNLPEEFVQYLSVELCSVITAMMTPRPADRPSAALLLRDQMYKVCVCVYVCVCVCVCTHMSVYLCVCVCVELYCGVVVYIGILCVHMYMNVEF